MGIDDMSTKLHLFEPSQGKKWQHVVFFCRAALLSGREQAHGKISASKRYFCFGTVPFSYSLNALVDKGCLALGTGEGKCERRAERNALVAKLASSRETTWTVMGAVGSTYFPQPPEWKWPVVKKVPAEGRDGGMERVQIELKSPCTLQAGNIIGHFCWRCWHPSQLLPTPFSKTHTSRKSCQGWPLSSFRVSIAASGSFSPFAFANSIGIMVIFAERFPSSLPKAPTYDVLVSFRIKGRRHFIQLLRGDLHGCQSKASDEAPHGEQRNKVSDLGSKGSRFSLSQKNCKKFRARAYRTNAHSSVNVVKI